MSLRKPAILVLVLSLNGSGYSQEYSDYYNFGDSLSETGNLYSQWNFPATPPYYNGRISNGPIWLDVIQEDLGLPEPRPSRLGGNNFAWGGAMTGLGNSIAMPVPVPNVGKQIQQFRQRDERFASDTLISLWVGVNDIGEGILPETVMERLKGHIQELHDLGGRNFLIPNYLSLWHDVGPLNDLFAAEMPEFDLPETQIILIDIAGLVETSEANPGLFGITSIDAPACADCQGSGNPNPVDIDPNPEKFAFWDEAHLTGRMNELMGMSALRLIKHPAFAGDLNLNGDVDVQDVDGLVAAIVRGTTDDTFFDLSDDGIVDTADLMSWLADAAELDGFNQPYQLGDANLDGTVDAEDLNSLGLNWRQSVATWSGGDFTADGIVNSPDLNALALNWRQSIPMASAISVPVPEPTTLLLTVAGLAFFWRGRIRG
jgi:phospholipase/lecithinase/hemolysin